MAIVVLEYMPKKESLMGCAEVPREPAAEMIEACLDVYKNSQFRSDLHPADMIAAVWRAMVDQAAK